ncbi:MAG: SDR family NAD(P)-dependent oxidoreductase [Planctomycetota bacterium]
MSEQRDDYQGRHAIVTGGTGALGLAVVRELIGRGATVSIPVFEPKELGRLTDGERERVTAVEGVDLSDEASASGFYGGVCREHGGLWASVHVAGGFAFAPVEEAGADVLDSMYATNVKTCYLSCREAIRVMRASGGGRIVNIAAGPALRPEQGAKMTAYTMSKAAVGAMTGALAEEVKGDGILINAVAPSIFDTPANRAAMPDADHDAWPKPDQIASAIAFLGSPTNTLTSGAVVPVYGRS